MSTLAINPGSKDFAISTLTSFLSKSPLILKIQSIWNQCKYRLGGVFRDAFYLPLFRTLSLKDKEQIQKEELYFANFWDPSKPVYPELSLHKEIKETFTKKIELVTISIEGKKLGVNCLIIESNEDSTLNEKTRYNFIHALGNFSKINNNIMSTYPFMSSYLKQKKENPNIPPARFIIISQYDTIELDGPQQNLTYKARTLNESGLILAESIKELAKRYGQANQLVAHSIGCVVLTSGLKYFDASSDYIPKHIHLDRGPSSILKMSHRAFGGWIYFPLAFLTGWALDFGEEVASFCRKTSSLRQGNYAPSILVSAVQHDHIFPEDTNLYQSPQIQTLRKNQEITVLPFTPPLQWIGNSRALHCASNAVFSSLHLPSEYEDQSFINPDETLSDAVIRRSLPKSA